MIKKYFKMKVHKKQKDQAANLAFLEMNALTSNVKESKARYRCNLIMPAYVFYLQQFWCFSPKLIKERI